MADDKIRISWDEVQSTQVDEQIKRQAAVARAAQQMPQFANPQMPPLPQAIVPTKAKSWLYNSLIYMALFGGIGGFFGWTGGEVIELVFPDPLDELREVIREESEITAAARNGEISNAEAAKLQDELQERHRSNPYVAIILNHSLTEAEQQRQIKERREKDETRALLQQFLMLSAIAMPLAFFLSIGDQVVSRNWAGTMICGSVALVLGLSGGLLVGLFINKMYQALGGGSAESLVGQIAARAITWGVLGAFLTIAPGVVLKNFKRLGIGLAGGFIGGLIGGTLFDPISFFFDNAVVSRFFGFITIGVLAGIGTGLIENAAKSGWLKVVAGLITGKQFVLYRNPTIIGSAPQCEIYLFKDPQVGPRHAALHTVGRGFEIESLHPGGATFVNGQPILRARLRNGDQVQIGSTAFVFQEKERSQLG